MREGLGAFRAEIEGLVREVEVQGGVPPEILDHVHELRDAAVLLALRAKQVSCRWGREGRMVDVS
jgi:hypothetical protein